MTQLENAAREDEAFRLGLRGWLAAAYAGFVKDWPGGAEPRSLDFRRAWEDTLCANGWSGLGWPKEHGGRALPLSRQAVFHEEHARCGAPLGVNLIGHGILAPTLLHFGTEAQKRRFLPGILSNREVWCQGYSEPGAGSDLAAVRTRAEAAPGGYRLNGHKIWTSFADRAQWCFVLARTDAQAPKHKGLSFLLVDMRSAGVRVEPIRQITGEAEFCEVFFEDVFVPEDCLLGAPNQGWKIAMAAASFERGTYFIPRLVRFAQELRQVRELALRADAYGHVPASSAAVRHQWARLAADSHVLALKSQRALAGAMRGDPPGPEGSSTKIHWSEAHQRLLELSLQLLGEDACLADDASDAHAAELTHAYLWSRAETILAGTSEIQRNIIAEQMLGLPKA
ncbi:acyl-CoA dehydrogenase family protein [Achromobacter xylosoxidans]|uniref:Acyl-CoA dehydrogenase n=1 Tax=Alcaligenes xylosoxydans xylosoxydans TaxID=85698 RepID=A0A424WET8_ALCXX|nr:acyl-CoA dehydrogenase family protein [Achromobacter xylosoxidans]MBC9904529.1 acyl-CoA dehydrogenase family protein [Achromobacter xylosoxidans]MBD0869474.1 acyl-CoA dehydrogenase family protein [Achromobacter xylosoxidans]QNP87989.1 acyl-CoA dehydrogenase family protein [Achromobacter xylosoxidans]RPJ91774.1 acyl-CoA dehydrogenase [Achromobacter xylosoxidans]